jgi:hypothetical protein
MKYKDEMVQEIEEMVGLMVSEGFEEYQELLIGDLNLKECSQTKLAQIRKRSQIYLHQAFIMKKKDVTTRINKITDMMGNYQLKSQLSYFTKQLDEKDFLHIKSIAGYYGLDDISNFIRDIDNLKKKGLLEGDIKIESTLSVPDYSINKLNLLKEKLELVKKAQHYDRTMQKHMGKEAKCVMEDSHYMSMIRNINEEITQLEG